MHLYIASSWRNTYYPEEVTALQKTRNNKKNEKKLLLR